MIEKSNRNRKEIVDEFQDHKTPSAKGYENFLIFLTFLEIL